MQQPMSSEDLGHRDTPFFEQKGNQVKPREIEPPALDAGSPADAGRKMEMLIIGFDEDPSFQFDPKNPTVKPPPLRSRK